MYILKETFSSSLDLPHGFIFDIETTGLSPKFHELVMISYAYQEDDQWIIEQHMAEESRDELLLLLHFFEFSKKFLYCIHYNGHSFDLPFINKRLHHNKMDFNYPKNRSFDLYLHLKKNQVKGSLKLSAQEKHAGFYRTDQLSGKQWVDLYLRYQDEKKQKQRSLLLLHNKEDVFGTLELVKSRPDFIEKISHHLYLDKLLVDAFPGKDELRLAFYQTELRYFDLPAISHGDLLFSETILGKDISAQEKKDALLAYGNTIFYSNIKKELERRRVFL